MILGLSMKLIFSNVIVFLCSIAYGYAQSEVKISRSTLSIPSSTYDIKIKIDEMQRDWRISPNVSPDTLMVECKNDQFTNVVFITDKKKQLFQVSGQDLIQFNILMDDGLSALTAIKCIKPRTRYKGDYSPERQNAGNYQKDLVPLLDTYFSDDRAGATLTIWKKGQLNFKYSKGLANIEASVVRNFQQLFDIASISKEFTAMSILQLVEAGKIKLEDTLEIYIKGLPNGKNITIHHLLTHTHGLPDVMQSEEFDGISHQNKEKTLNWLRNMKSQFEPGEKYEYGNTAYFVLSVIVERVSEQNLKSYIRNNLFMPAKMKDSHFLTDSNINVERVTGYNENNDISTIRKFDFHDSQASGTGDIVSTANDLIKWHRALSNGTILSKKMFEMALAPKYLNDGTKIDRGYGFAHGIFQNQNAIHNTGDLYTHTRYFYIPDQDLSIVLNMNGSIENDGGLASIVFMQIIGKVLNQQTLQMFDEVVDLNKL